MRVLLVLVMMAGMLGAQPERPIKRPLNNQLALEGPDAPVVRVESPQAVVGIASQLAFHVSPLSTKGLFSQQVEDAFKALDKANGSATFLKLRAFVAGSGDLRRVQSLVNEMLAARKLPLVAVTTIQVGSLLREGAQVLIESISEEKKVVSATGLRFVPAVEGANGAAAVAALRNEIGIAQALRITCFADSQAEAEAARAAAIQMFPQAASAFMQSTRYTLGSRVACEAVVQGGVAARILFAAGQVTFGTNVADLLLAFERIDRVMEPYRVHTQDAVSLNLYGTSRAVADQAKSLVGATPATSIFIEGLPSQDATLSVEAAVPLK